MDYLYHGSKVSGIVELETCSKLHNSEEKVVYLTNNIPYSLYYIWDEEHNGYHGKHVSGWIKGGIAYYEEQFPDQLKTFYKGVSGYLYYISNSVDIHPVENRESMFYSTKYVKIDKMIYIPDVYDELMKYEDLQEFKVLRYNDQSRNRQHELVDFITNAIIRKNFYRDNEEHASFMQKYFIEAWNKAKEMKNIL